MRNDIREVQLGFLHCLDVRHADWVLDWKPGMKPPLWGEYHSEQCSSCGSWRHRVQNTDGSIDPYYTYYELHPGYQDALDRFTREEARIEVKRRQRAKKTEVVRGARGKGHLRVAV